MRYLMILLLLNYIGVSQAQMGANLQEEIQKIISFDTSISPEDNPGYIIGIIVGDSVFVFPYGTINKDSLQAPDQHTLFEVGGMTKVFTAALVQQLVAEELMHYDSSLNSYLPASYRNPDCDQITIADLLHHTAGLPKMPEEFGAKEKEDNNPYAHYTKTDLLKFYRSYQPFEPYGTYLYSNLAYALLEVAIEQATRRSYKDLLEEKVLQMYGMDDSGIQIESKYPPAQGYSMSGQPTPPWMFKSFAASEGLITSMHDLLLFMKANLGQSHPAQQASLLALQKVRLHTGLTKESYMGGGWHVVRPRRKFDVLIHPGSTGGFRSFAGLVRETETAVIVLSNSKYGMGGLGMLILRMLNYNWKKKK